MIQIPNRARTKTAIAGREAEIVELGQRGLGYKAIRKRLGLPGCQWAVTSLLRLNGIMEATAKNQSVPHWGIEDLVQGQRAEREYDAAIRTAYKRTPLEYYYANHEERKRSMANRSYTKYWVFEKQDPQAQAVRNVRRILARIMRPVGHRRAMRKENILGCTYDEAKVHIIAQLPTHWTEADYGVKWEIDHIIPLVSFDLLDRAQLLRAAHYTNLRLLCRTLNRRLGITAREAKRRMQRAAA